MVTKNNTILVFDLDDTLYKEIDFLKSAFKEIAIFLSNETAVDFELIFNDMVVYYNSGLDTFREIINAYSIKTYCVEDLLMIYRRHKPQIHFKASENDILQKLKQMVFKVGLITDGRSIQQRNKIEALGLSGYFDDIIISEEFGTEKPHTNNYVHFVEKYGDMMNYVYVGDNIKKDFIAPNSLGWATICIQDNGQNIHKTPKEVSMLQSPQFTIHELSQLIPVILEIHS